MTFKDQGNGTALLQGTPTGTGGHDQPDDDRDQRHGQRDPAVHAERGRGTGHHQRGDLHVRHRQFGQLHGDHDRVPGPTITESGALPAGLTFANKGDGTATIAGTPGAGTGGAYSVTLTAANGIGTASSKALGITVNQAPAITSKSSVNGSTFHSFNFPITATGYPKPTITETGGLPLGLKFSGGANGSAAITGTPILPGTYRVTINAKSTAGTATQGLTINIAFALTKANVQPSRSSTGKTALAVSGGKVIGGSSGAAISPYNTSGSGGTAATQSSISAASAPSTPAALPVSHFWWRFHPID